MFHVSLSQSRLCGQITLPPSKSVAHRAILCGALAKGKSVISPISLSADIRATINAVEQMGAAVHYRDGTLTVDGTNTGAAGSGNTVPIHCRESGSTLRFLIPVAAAFGLHTVFTGEGRLPERPIGIYLDCLPGAGVSCETHGGLPLTLSGRLLPGTFAVPGDISSQFITGLLFALPLLEKDSDIILTTPLESAGYVDITLEVLSSFGISVDKTEDGYHIKGGQHYLPHSYSVASDWSQAAFFLAAAAFGGELTLSGLDFPSAQGDSAAYGLFRRFGASVEMIKDTGAFKCSPSGGPIRAQDIDAAQIPDLVPILAVTAALADGTTRITKAGRLRIKESDRISTTCSLIRALGGRCEEQEDGMTIRGVKSFQGAQVDGAGDHRIVMAAAIAALRAEGRVVIRGAQAVDKSFPTFFEEYTRLGGIADVIDIRTPD